MKKIVSLILVITIMLLVGCEEVSQADTKINYIQDTNIWRIVVDKETGVNYIIYNGGRSGIDIIPRVNADGTPYVSGVNGNE